MATLWCFLFKDMKEIKVNAHGKINLSLDVLGTRPDGYHELDMIMQSVGICDVLTIKAVSSDELETPDQIVVTDNAGNLGAMKDNLAYRAAKLLVDEFGIEEKIHIHIEKNIPIAGGMAGGSADCAATLKGINEMFDLGLDLEGLKERGVKLGADVPFCILGGTARAQGIGEVLTPLTTCKLNNVLIAKPDISVSTAEVYNRIDTTPVERHPDTEALIKALANEDYDAIGKELCNVLELVTEPDYEVITQIKNIMKDEGAFGAMMTGSGPTVFGLFEKIDDATKAFDAIEKANLTSQLYLTDFVD